MSITTFGVDGYDFQYLASLYLILLLQRDVDDYGFFIEKLNSEDMTVQLKSGEFIEVQFKKRSNIFDISELSSCLAKFDPRSDSVNILSKLINSQIKLFYIITNAHADSFARELGILAKPNLLESYSSKSAKKLIPSLVDSLKAVYSPQKTKLEKNRHNSMQANAVQMTDKFNKRLLSEKVLVIDRLENITLDQNISALLNEHSIPFSQHQTLIGELIKIIKDNRSNNQDVLPIILNKLQHYSISLPSIIGSYAETGKEKSLYRQLTSLRFILLSGVTLCGKTQTALYLARKLLEERKGMNYLATSHVFQAEDFLLANVSEDRLILLEDPFGQKYNDQAVNINNQIKILLQHIEGHKNRFLIITANTGVTEKLTNSHNFATWQNLTITDANILKSHWLRISGIELSDLDFFTKNLFEVLENDPQDQLLQFGQLDHLFANRDSITQINIQTIRHLGNFKVADIFQEMLNLEIRCQNVLLLLAVCCNGSRGLTLVDLEFLLFSEQNYYPGIIENDNNMGTLFFGRGNKDEQRLAVYCPLGPLSSEIKDDILSLTNRGYLLAGMDNFRFKHPIYEEAAKQLLNGKDNIFRFDKILDYACKAIGSLNEKLALNVLSNMSICLQYLEGDKDNASRLLEKISMGLQSTFGNVRDHTQILLGANYINLTNNLAETVETSIRNRGYHSNDYYWDGDTPFIPATPHSSSRSGILDRMKMRTAGAKKWKKLFNSNIHLSPKDANLALENLISRTEHQPKRINYSISSLIPLLRYNEVFIREQAAYLIASSLDDQNFEANKHLLLEDKPFIKYQLLRGLFRAWPYFNVDKNKHQVLESLKVFLADPYVALLSVDLFTQFSIDYGPSSFKWKSEIEKSAIPAMWHLWANLTPALTSSLPTEVHIHTARFYTTFSETKATEEEMSLVLESWLKWLLRHLKVNTLLWLKEIEETILNAFDLNFDLLKTEFRGQYITDLFKVSKGILQSFMVRMLLSKWGSLNSTERILVIKQVNTKDYLLPITLTGVTFPIELQNKFSIFLHQNTLNKLLDLPNKLLMKCLTQLYIFPPTTNLDWAERQTWNEVLAISILNPKSDAFKVAFQVYVQDKGGYKPFGHIEWPKGDLIKQILLLRPGIVSFIFDILLEDLLENNGSESKALWEQFFNSLPKDQQSRFAGEILKVLEGVDNFEGNLDCIPNFIFLEFINPHLKSDIIVFQTLRYTTTIDADEVLTKLFEQLIESDKLRLKGSVSRIRNWCKRHGEISANLSILSDNYLTAHFEKVCLQTSLHRKKKENYFNGWYPDWASNDENG